MFCDFKERTDDIQWFSFTGILVFAFIFSGTSIGASLIRGASETVPPLASNPTVSPSTALPEPLSPAKPKGEGGDQLPVVVDPESPGSCALVTNSETCQYCCSDVFNEITGKFDTCIEACVKAEANHREH